MRARLFVCMLLVLSVASNTSAAETESSLTLAAVAQGKAQIVDLTYPLNEQTNYWPGPKYAPFELKTIATIEKDGVLSKSFCMPEHMGTHIDAPNHFERNQPAVDKIDPKDLIAPGVVIDVRAAATSDADFQLQRKHVLDWEQEQGRIPDGAVVMLHTGWGRFWNTPVRYQNKDARGRLRFPGFSAEAATLLINERKAKGLGIDTLSIDRGLSKDFAAHHVVNGAGRYALENVAKLDQLPPRNFYLIVAPIKIESGSGGPTRIFAIVPRK